MTTNRTYEVWAPAKINLYLEVTGRRSDGFHEIVTLMMAINIYDTLYFTIDRSPEIRLTTRWGVGAGKTSEAKEGDQSLWGDVPVGDKNIVVRAVKLLRERAGRTEGCHMTLIKRIPSAAGLGGASSDAAAALRAANRAWQIDWPVSRLADIGAEIGSDVPFFLYNHTFAVCRGRGEQVESISGRGDLAVVVVRPPEGLSTARVYQALDGLTSAVRQADVGPTSAWGTAHVGPVLAAVRTGSARQIGGLLHNRLQAPAERLVPSVRKLIRRFDGLGSLGHQMSGSGTSCFAILPHVTAARRLARALRTPQIGFVTYATTALAAPRLHWSYSLKE